LRPWCSSSSRSWCWSRRCYFRARSLARFARCRRAAWRRADRHATGALADRLGLDVAFQLLPLICLGSVAAFLVARSCYQNDLHRIRDFTLAHAAGSAR
jgi:hypothetical protein